MSLLDAFLRENLLTRSVMQQNYYIAWRMDGVTGSGTREDPWDGSTQSKFDAAMRQVPANATVFLGPTWVEDPNTHVVSNNPFQTNGCPTPGGWISQPGQRIVGAGVNITTLQLVNHTTDNPNAAIGLDFTVTNPFLNGFEVSDLTIDANLPSSAGSNLAASGILVSGNNIYIARVRVINWGSITTSGHTAGTGVGISGANYQSASNPSSNVVIENCVLEASPNIPTPASNPNGKNIAIQLAASSSMPHQNCVIRNCFIDGLDTAITREIRGIMADGGLGTIVEFNRIVNCRYAGPFYDEVLDSGFISNTTDLIIRENYCQNVYKGIYLKRNNPTVSNPISRIIVLQNQIELANVADASGIFFDAATDSTSPSAAFTNLIIRGNRVRPVVPFGQNPSDTYGIVAKSVQNLTYDNNWIDAKTPDKAAQRGAAVNVQAFNNRTLAGDLLPVAIGSTAPILHQGELTTDAELLIAEL